MVQGIKMHIHQWWSNRVNGKNWRGIEILAGVGLEEVIGNSWEFKNGDLPDRVAQRNITFIWYFCKIVSLFITILVVYVCTWKFSTSSSTSEIHSID